MSPALIALIIILSFTLFAAVFFFFLGPYLIRKAAITSLDKKWKEIYDIK